MDRKYILTLNNIDMDAVEKLHSDQEGIRKLDAAVITELDHIFFNLGEFEPPSESFSIEIVKDENDI